MALFSFRGQFGKVGPGQFMLWNYQNMCQALCLWLGTRQPCGSAVWLRTGNSRFPYTHARGSLSQRPGQGASGAQRRQAKFPSLSLALWEGWACPWDPNRNIASSHCPRVNNSKVLGPLVPHQDHTLARLAPSKHQRTTFSRTGSLLSRSPEGPRRSAGYLKMFPRLEMCSKLRNQESPFLYPLWMCEGMS